MLTRNLSKGKTLPPKPHAAANPAGRTRIKRAARGEAITTPVQVVVAARTKAVQGTEVAVGRAKRGEEGTRQTLRGAMMR